MVKSGEMVRGGGGTRPVRYEDCCILLATRGRFTEYAEALAARGIAVYADSAEDLLAAPHIRPLIALLRVIDNPAQDIDLAATMLGPLFGFEENDLVRLRARQKANGAERASLYGAVVQVAEGDEQTPFARRIRGFYARLGVLRRMSHSVPVERLLEEIFASTGYLAALGAMENGARRREDARKFAAFCAGKGAGGVAALVRAIEATEAAGGYVDSAPGAARPGCVTIMTIHRSKGLQFPVVFLADTGHRFNEEDTRRPVLLHREYGIGLKLRPAQAGEGGEQGGLYKTPAYTALVCAHGQEMRSEQMRLLYVALTRAQDKLVVTVPLPAKNPEEPLVRDAAFLAAGAGQTLHERADCFADWLRAALLVHPCGGALRTMAGARELPFADTPSAIAIGIEAPNEAEAGEAEVAAVVPAAPDEALVAQLRAGFAWQYPAAALNAVPAKVSVTSVVHKAEATALERPAFLSADGLTAAEMGTALHAFLQHADFAALAQARRAGGRALAEAITAENRRQVELRLTAPNIAARLDERHIRRFFESEAFARIEAADEVLREYPFITAIPAGEVLAAQGGEAAEAVRAEKAQVLVQGIADLVLLYPDHIELLDYKTDRGKSEADFLAAYRPQLDLYARAIEKRFAPRCITYKGIYSFALDRLIEA
jgi:ATP-dependent helicase/nuclease subunit A